MALVCVLPTGFIETNLHLGEVDPAVDSFIQLAQWKQRAGVARERYQELQKILHDTFHVELPSLRKKEAHLNAHTQIAPVWIDCCIQGCMAFTGKHHDLTACRYCHEKRYQPQSLKPRARYIYIPLLNRLALQYRNPTRSRILKGYRRQLQHTLRFGQWRDFFDGELFRTYHCRKLGLFTQHTDIALHLSLDGVQLTQGKTYQVSNLNARFCMCVCKLLTY